MLKPVKSVLLPQAQTIAGKIDAQWQRFQRVGVPARIVVNSDDLSYVQYRNTRYSEQNDRVLIGQELPQYPIRWGHLFDEVQTELRGREHDLNMIYTTTATLAQINGTRITVAHCGDSRATVLVVDPKYSYAKEVWLTQDKSHEDIATRTIAPIEPDVSVSDIRERRFSGFSSRTRKFLIVETDGMHLHSDENIRASLLARELRQKPNFDVNAHTLAIYFADLAEKVGSTDNMSIVVTEIDKRDKKRSDLIGVFDGAGAGSYVVSDPVCDLFMQKVGNAPRDWKQSVPSVRGLGLSVQSYYNRYVENGLFRLDFD